MARNYHVAKIILFRSNMYRGKFGHGLCMCCVERNPGKNMFSRARRGTC